MPSSGGWPRYRPAPGRRQARANKSVRLQNCWEIRRLPRQPRRGYAWTYRQSQTCGPQNTTPRQRSRHCDPAIAGESTNRLDRWRGWEAESVYESRFLRKCTDGGYAGTGHRHRAVGNQDFPRCVSRAGWRRTETSVQEEARDKGIISAAAEAFHFNCRPIVRRRFSPLRRIQDLVDGLPPPGHGPQGASASNSACTLAII